MLPSSTNPLPAAQLLAKADDLADACNYNDPIGLAMALEAYRAARSASPVTLEEADAEEAARKMVMGWRGIAPDDRVCVKCAGSGVRTYGNTTTWYGGIGGQQMTSDTCDRCWGSGAENRPWLNLKNNARRLAGEGGGQ